MVSKELHLDAYEAYVVQNARCVGVRPMLSAPGEPPYGVKLDFDNGAEIHCVFDRTVELETDSIGDSESA